MNSESNPPAAQPSAEPSNPSAGAGPASQGRHIATISSDSRFWDVFVEFDDDPSRIGSFGARLCFSPSDADDASEAVRTTTILIEPSYEEVLYRARAFEVHQLVGLLRSCLPG